MRGSLTLEFILSLVLLIATAGGFLMLSYGQIENSVIASTQYKAEAMAMSTGSALTHFFATEPEYGSYMEMDFRGLPQEAAGQSSFGMPGFGVYASGQECNVSIDIDNSMVIVNILVYRIESSEPELVTAKYPFASGVSAGACSGEITLVKTVGCGKGISVSMQADGGYLINELGIRAFLPGGPTASPLPFTGDNGESTPIPTPPGGWQLA
ncbi:hypothetical protein ACFLQ2_02290 [archaeon]